MAANYWTSTQRKFWSFTPDKLADIRDDLEKQHAPLLKNHPYYDRRLMFIFLRDRLLQLVYMHRYFLSTPLQSVNLYLLAATAFYLASKTEESPHHIRLVAAEARQFWPEFIPNDVSRLGEMEFCLISEMRSQLIVWHPYRTLIELKDNKDLKLSHDELGLAWCIINDSFLTDLPLTCEPQLIAIIAIFLATVFVPLDPKSGLRQPSSDHPINMEHNAFPSMGMRPGMAGVLGSAMQGLPMNPPSSLPATTNGYSMTPTRTTSTDQSKPLALSDIANDANAVQSSEKFNTMVKFLIDSDIDLKQMINATQQIISLYSVWEGFDEKDIKNAVLKCLKENNLNG